VAEEVSGDVGVKSEADATQRSGRLSVIHFLGWMVGCGAVLAIYRAGSHEHTLIDSLRQLGGGLAYGTAASGLGLFLWRWKTRSGPLPSQPGHWLLVFGAIGMGLDFVTTGVYLAAQRAGLPETFSPWLFQQLAAWGSASAIGFAVVTRLRGASTAWYAAAIVVVIGIALNAAADMISLFGLAVSWGTWPYYVPIWTHVVVTPLALPAIWAAELSDRVRRVPRDWLHLAGIAAISMLGVADFAVTLTQAIRYWR